MAFGQQSGPPASARDLKELLALLQSAGYQGFRDARGPLGFNQRQGTGKFTRDEATVFIEQLQEAESEAAMVEVIPDTIDEIMQAPPPPAAAPRPRAARAAKPAKTAVADIAAPPAPDAASGPDLADVSADHLAGELRRRGWIVIAP